MKVLLASSEVHPYSKTGGLADMVGALAKFLAQAGLRAGLVTPLYKGILENFPALRRHDWGLNLPLGSRNVQAEILLHEWKPGLTVYFVHQPEFFHRAELYQEKGVDYPDNADRFIFFSKCVAHLARYLSWQPELVHVHDWQAGLVPLLIRHQRDRAGWGTAPKTCLTVHNLAYQGVFPARCYGATNLPRDYFQPEGVEFHGSMNCLKAALVYADTITTVSPRYAREILTEPFGCGLDGVLRGRRNSVVGILNGVDYTEWRSEGNPFLPHAFTSRDFRGKDATKLALQRELGLPAAADIPLFGNISRLVDQKGSDLLLGALAEMLATNLQFVLLGSGSPALENAFRNLSRRYPDKVAVRIGYDHPLSHRIEAGCDFFLMPSRFEPCGLNQMYSLHYGTIPIVRGTGGLDDSVTDLSENFELANGIKFYESSTRALAKGIRKALALYLERGLLRKYRENAMAADFSWERSAGKYIEVFRQTLSTPSQSS